MWCFKFIFKFFCQCISTAKTFQKPTPDTNKRCTTMGRSNFFWCTHPHSQSLPEAYTGMKYNKKRQKTCGVLTFLLWIHLHTQNLPEAYTWMRYNKKLEHHVAFEHFFCIHFHSHNLPEDNTWMKYNKAAKPCSIFSFFLHPSPQPEPSGSLLLIELQNARESYVKNSNFSLRVDFRKHNLPLPYSAIRLQVMKFSHPHTQNEIQKNCGNHAAFYLFSVTLFSQPITFQTTNQCAITFGKCVSTGKTFHTKKDNHVAFQHFWVRFTSRAKTFQNRTPEWDTKTRKNLWRFSVVMQLHLHGQALPEAHTWMR